MEIKAGLILKFFLIFNFLLTFGYPLSAQENNADELEPGLDDSSSVLDLEEEINYPGKPLIMSLVLPGAGQYYNKSPFWKTGG